MLLESAVLRLMGLLVPNPRLMVGLQVYRQYCFLVPNPRTTVQLHENESQGSGAPQ